MEFAWDGDKEQANIDKHDVNFAEAATVFGDPFEVTILDPDHSIEEYRFLSVGMSSAGRVLVVSYSERSDNRIRIISVRAVSHKERRQYETRT